MRSGKSITALLDTNVLVAHLFQRDTNHAIANRALMDAHQHLVVASPSMVELSFLLTDRLGYRRMLQGIKVVRQIF